MTRSIVNITLSQLQRKRAPDEIQRVAGQSATAALRRAMAKSSTTSRLSAKARLLSLAEQWLLHGLKIVRGEKARKVTTDNLTHRGGTMSDQLTAGTTQAIQFPVIELILQVAGVQGDTVIFRVGGCKSGGIPMQWSGLEQYAVDVGGSLHVQVAPILPAVVQPG